MPSAVPASKAEAIRLPYFEVHFAELAPAAPSRCMPRGKTQRLVRVS
jgi:hypothetical protein